MTITINTYDDLLRFIQNDKVTISESVEVTNRFLNVYCSNEVKSREIFIETVKDYINKWGDYDGEKPFFLDMN